MIQGEMHDAWGRVSESRQMPPLNKGRPLHRIAEVMQEEGIKLRTASRRMQTPLSQVQAQQDASYNLSLKDLYRWQAALQVPLLDLLVEQESSLSAPIRLRANLLKIMKTVRSIQEGTEKESIQRLAQNMVQQLVGMMPELQEVGGWPTVGQRRKSDEVGVIEERRMADEIFEGYSQGVREPEVVEVRRVWSEE
jgi:hypothetical protein